MSKAAARTPATPGVLEDPIRNRRVAFTAAERETLGLTGRLPSAVLTLEEQARRVYSQLQRQSDDLAKNVYLEQLHDRNEVLYHQVLADHLAELLPVVYDPTAGDAIERYSRGSDLGAGAEMPRHRASSPTRPTSSSAPIQNERRLTACQAPAQPDQP